MSEERSAEEVEVTERTSSTTRGQIVDLDFVRGLIDAVDSSGIDSLEISRAGTRIRISKNRGIAQVAPGFTPGGQPELEAPTPVQPQASPQTPPPAAAPEPAAADSSLIEVTSPMVGTFYRAPSPEAPAYVEVGSRVVKGQTLCILEAMKLMNELESEVAGVVREICVENAEPVEYGQVLFRIEPSA